MQSAALQPADHMANSSTARRRCSVTASSHKSSLLGADTACECDHMLAIQSMLTPNKPLSSSASSFCDRDATAEFSRCVDSGSLAVRRAFRATFENCGYARDRLTRRVKERTAMRYIIIISKQQRHRAPSSSITRNSQDKRELPVTGSLIKHRPRTPLGRLHHLPPPPLLHPPHLLLHQYRPPATWRSAWPAPPCSHPRAACLRVPSVP